MQVSLKEIVTQGIQAVGNIKNNLEAALLFAAEKRDLAKVNRILSTKTAINVNTVEVVDGNTALHLAVRNSDIEMVDRLLQVKEINVNVANKDGDTPLHLAADNADIEIIDMLLQAGSNVNALNKNDDTPLHLVARNKDAEPLYRCIRGASNAYYKNAAWRNLSRANRAIKQTINRLLQAGSNVNAANKDGNTPLHFAARGEYEIVDRLLQVKGSNVNVANKDGNTPLHLAALGGYEKIVDRLLQVEGIEVDVTNKDGDTPLRLAAGNKYDRVVKRLIAALVIEEEVEVIA